MLFSIPKLPETKDRRTNATWFLFFAGHDPSSDLMKCEIIVGWCPDLMHPRLDKGRSIPALLAFQWTWFGPETRRMIGTGHNTIFRFRSDWKEIFRRLNARRLANADV